MPSASPNTSDSDIEQDLLASAYEASDSAVTAGKYVVDYDPERLSTIMVLLTWRGTVFRNAILWVEQLLVVGVYIATALIVHRGDMRDEEVQKDATGLADKMATLAAFLLGFYTSLTVSRWWRLRTDGIGNIWSATSQLSLFLSQFVTRDKQILEAVRRYARASLAIIFLKRRYGAERLSEKLDILISDGILLEDEVEQLRKYNNNLAESIWTWIAHIVADLDKKGKIKGEVMLNFLMERVNLGRSGAALIGAQLGTPIPLPYIHLMGILVKIHNGILGITLASFLAAPGRKAGLRVCCSASRSSLSRFCTTQFCWSTQCWRTPSTARSTTSQSRSTSSESKGTAQATWMREITSLHC
eukprot:s2544_g3.t1